MGEVFRPKDLLRARRKVIEEALQDLSPGVRDAVKSVLETYTGEEEKERLIKVLGKKGAEELLKKFKAT